MITDHRDLIAAMCEWEMGLDGLEIPSKPFQSQLNYVPGWIEFFLNGAIIGLGDKKMFHAEFPFNEEELRSVIVKLIEASM